MGAEVVGRLHHSAQPSRPHPPYRRTRDALLVSANSESVNEFRVDGQPACVYTVAFAGRTLELLGPQHPHDFPRARHIERPLESEGYLPFWRQPWPAAVMLLEYLLRTLRGSQEPILEIGAGLGTVAIGLTLCGYRVITTDYDEAALCFAAASAARNRVTLHGIERLDWRVPPSRRFRTIVASDILYHPSFAAPVATFLTSGLGDHGSAYLSDMNRRAADAFPAALEAHGLCCTVTAAAAHAIPYPGAVDGRVLRGRIFSIRGGRTGAVPNHG